MSILKKKSAPTPVTSVKVLDDLSTKAVEAKDRTDQAATVKAHLEAL